MSSEAGVVDKISTAGGFWSGLKEKILAPERKESLKQLDNFPGIFDNNKVELLGVYCGIKKAMFGGGLICEDVLTPDFNNLKSIIKGLGLEVKIVINEVDYFNPKAGVGYYNFFVGSDRSNLLKLLSITEAPEKRSGFNELRGRLLGYPETAVMAYIGQIEKLGDEERTKFHQDNLATRFSGLIFSKEHCQEEMEAYNKRLMEATRQYLPKTYEKIAEGKTI